ncbi:MAG: tyrosine-type recombinase/integrase [Lachnospiraceae bacterium]|nr:tyrosine-type recombinase/integrase [Lachnospiraceae bacterium]
MNNLIKLKTETHNKILMLERAKTSIEEELKCGIIDDVEAVLRRNEMDSKISKLKKEAVLKVHIKKNGSPKAIKYLEKSEIWRTLVDGEKPIYGITEEIVIDKLFDYYGLSLDSTLFKDVFSRALNEKATTENISKKTVKHLKSDYNRFFVKYSNTLPEKDIRNITVADLKAYTQAFTNDKHPTLAIFKAYKGILNLIFDYAYANGIIALNPVSGIKNSAYNKSMSATKHTAEEKIFSVEEIEKIKAEVNKRFTYTKKYNNYFINGYAILFSIETGCRIAEICSLKWKDVKDTVIWIHSQQTQNADNEWEELPYTKNERLLPPDARKGREYPITNNIRAILDELKAKQEQLGIKSEYVFCHEDGDWIKTTAYQTCLRRLCRHVFGKDCDITNNHAFRMSLNSNIFIPKGLPVTERARLLGHSVETNLKRYSFAGKGNIADICELLNA